MEQEYVLTLRGGKRRQWEDLIRAVDLTPGPEPDVTVLVWDGDRLAATGSRQGNILKYIAVDRDYQGQDLTASVLTALRQDAFSRGMEHLFLYTKPKNGPMFTPLFFYPVAQTDDILLMENVRDGVQSYLDTLPAGHTGTVGAAVMNCNPFTLGHRYLIETAARECDWLYVLVLAEEQGLFPAADRLELVRRGTADLKNVIVCSAGPYLISSATFPDYFLRDRDHCEEAHCLLDVDIFVRHYAPRLGITRRYVGSEPLSPLTARYNEALLRHLPPHGIEVHVLPRRETAGTPISASAVRALLGTHQPDRLRSLVPDTTFRYLEARQLI